MLLFAKKSPEMDFFSFTNKPMGLFPNKTCLKYFVLLFDVHTIENFVLHPTVQKSSLSDLYFDTKNGLKCGYKLRHGAIPERK